MMYSEYDRQLNLAIAAPPTSLYILYKQKVHGRSHIEAASHYVLSEDIRHSQLATRQTLLPDWFLETSCWRRVHLF